MTGVQASSFAFLLEEFSLALLSITSMSIQELKDTLGAAPVHIDVGFLSSWEGSEDFVSAEQESEPFYWKDYAFKFDELEIYKLAEFIRTSIKELDFSPDEVDIVLRFTSPMKLSSGGYFTLRKGFNKRLTNVSIP